MKKLLKLQIISILFCVIFGGLLHFLFEMTGENKIVAIFSSVNESVWEHLKLVFFPMLVFAIIEYFIVGKKFENYIFAKTCALIFGMFYITTMFYTYTGIIGDNFLPIDIIIFIFAIVLSEYIAYIIILDRYNDNKKEELIEKEGKKISRKKRKHSVELVLVLLIVVCFGICTFNPPKISYFQDAVTGEFGIIDK